MYPRERCPGIDEHGSGKNDASTHSQEQPRFGAFSQEIFPVEMLLVKIRTEPKKRCDTTKGVRAVTNKRGREITHIMEMNARPTCPLLKS